MRCIPWKTQHSQKTPRPARQEAPNGEEEEEEKTSEMDSERKRVRTTDKETSGMDQFRRRSTAHHCRHHLWDEANKGNSRLGSRRELHTLENGQTMGNMTKEKTKPLQAPRYRRKGNNLQQRNDRQGNRPNTNIAQWESKKREFRPYRPRGTPGLTRPKVADRRKPTNRLEKREGLYKKVPVKSQQERRRRRGTTSKAPAMGSRNKVKRGNTTQDGTNIQNVRTRTQNGKGIYR